MASATQIFLPSLIRMQSRSIPLSPNARNGPRPPDRPTLISKALAHDICRAAQVPGVRRVAEERRKPLPSESHQFVLSRLVSRNAILRFWEFSWSRAVTVASSLGNKARWPAHRPLERLRESDFQKFAQLCRSPELRNWVQLLSSFCTPKAIMVRSTNTQSYLLSMPRNS
jgi:hypothetical protein